MDATTVALLAAAVLALAGAAGFVWRTFTMGGWHGTSCAVCRRGTLRPHRPISKEG
jgi:hypothetical protein